MQTEASVSKVSIELPVDLALWLEDEALRVKRIEGRSRPSKSAVVAEALRRLREAQGKE